MPRPGHGIIWICVRILTFGLHSFTSSRSLIWENAVLHWVTVWPLCAFSPCLSFSGSREAAFVYAISSAGVVYALTRACSQGELKTCNCDPHKRGRASDDRGEFDWGGCSDNINYGIKFAKAFIDAKERTVRDARALMNLHNNRCGRTVRKHIFSLTVAYLALQTFVLFVDISDLGLHSHLILTCNLYLDTWCGQCLWTYAFIWLISYKCLHSLCFSLW